MAEKCSVCGERMGGMFGKEPAKQEYIDKLKKHGYEYSFICHTCAKKKVVLLASMGNEELIQHVENKKKESSIFITPSAPHPSFSDLGLVTGYCIMGTGPLTTLSSAVTDMFGEQSNAYIEKITAAEEAALKMLKLNAMKKGGDAVYSCHVNLSEATSGHGMLMVSVYGTAVKTQSPDEDIQQAIETLKD